jgi:hypothetical protein
MRYPSGGTLKGKSTIPVLIFAAVAYFLFYWQIASLLTVVFYAIWFGPMQTARGTLPLIAVSLGFIALAIYVG